MRNNRGSSQRQINEEGVSLQADIKADIFTQIFDNMTKNMKDNEKIFFIFNKNQIKIWIQEKFKTTKLQLRIDSKSFSNYNCNHTGNNYEYRKYQLKNFTNFNVFFESCKGLLRLKITQTQISFRDMKDSNSFVNRVSSFRVQGLQIYSQEEDDLNKDSSNTKLIESGGHCKLILPKAKAFQQVIHSGNAMKIDKLYLSYEPDNRKLKFDCKQDDGCSLKIRVQQLKFKGTSKLDKIPFNFKKLKLATGLLQAQKACVLTLCNKVLVIDFDEQGRKKYNIIILSDVNI